MIAEKLDELRETRFQTILRLRREKVQENSTQIYAYLLSYDQNSPQLCHHWDHEFHYHDICSHAKFFEQAFVSSLYQLESYLKEHLLQQIVTGG
jgi:hypothetical protein